MRHTRAKRWALALGLTTMVVMSANAAPVTGGGVLATLSGSGPVSLTAMLICGTCVGAGIGMLLTDTWMAALSTMGSWKWVGICGGACAVALGLK
ncbi:MAG: hypothetical protein LJF06_10990 [Gemmatimonadetes bacterium]|nr:hypothetical protein [Gemmatimonadota bacterium]